MMSEIGVTPEAQLLAAYQPLERHAFPWRGFAGAALLGFVTFVAAAVSLMLVTRMSALILCGAFAVGSLTGFSWWRLVIALRRWKDCLNRASDERFQALREEAQSGARALNEALAAQRALELRLAEKAQAPVHSGTAVRDAERGQLLALAERFEGSAGEITGKLSQAVSDLQGMAASLAAAAERTSTQAIAVAAASGQTATSVKSISKAGEEVSASTLEISQQAAVSAEISARAVREMAQSERSMDLLTENTEQIGRVTELIASIAARTKLLAINATIEASRASEGGRGFIVVANEIKALASQTAGATQQIAVQITSVRDATEGSAAALRTSSQTLANIDQAATAIAAATHQQSYAAAEVARHVQNAAHGSVHVSKSIADVSAAAEETGRAANDLLHSATGLAEEAEFLREQVSEFLASIRAM